MGLVVMTTLPNLEKVDANKQLLMELKRSWITFQDEFEKLVASVIVSVVLIKAITVAVQQQI
jgi:hypothetical protein